MGVRLSDSTSRSPIFGSFFYLLRARGLDVSIQEWLTLMEALKLGLHQSTMTGFYRLCMAVLCKSETDFDCFQQAFLEYFRDIEFYQTDGQVRTEIPDEVFDWLNHPGHLIRPKYTSEDVTEEQRNLTDAQMESMLKERIKEQDERHNTGSYWIGTWGISPFGNSGFAPRGIRIGGVGKNGSAMRVAGKREFRDFRNDNVLDIRQFQMAFRLLRKYTQMEGAEEEFDVEQTIQDTCNKGGILQIRYRKPRRNQIKVLMLMDSGGSMYRHSRLCSQLFQAASLSNRFQDFQVYYFHNCPREFLYTHPSLEDRYALYTSDVLRRCNRDYRVIFVGDATMDPSDLSIYPPGDTDKNNMGWNGMDWLKYIASRYRHSIWLNPIKPADGSMLFPYDEESSYRLIDSMFQMYRLSVDGLRQAMRKLMVSQ